MVLMAEEAYLFAQKQTRYDQVMYMIVSVLTWEHFHSLRSKIYKLKEPCQNMDFSFLGFPAPVLVNSSQLTLYCIKGSGSN